MGLNARWQVLCDASEFDELPVRHNEDIMNENLAATCPLPPIGAYDSSHTKCHLLLQARHRLTYVPATLTCQGALLAAEAPHCRLQDGHQDSHGPVHACAAGVCQCAVHCLLNGVQAMIDMCADSAMLASVLHTITLCQVRLAQ